MFLKCYIESIQDLETLSSPEDPSLKSSFSFMRRILSTLKRKGKKAIHSPRLSLHLRSEEGKYFLKTGKNWIPLSLQKDFVLNGYRVVFDVEDEEEIASYRSLNKIDALNSASFSRHLSVLRESATFYKNYEEKSSQDPLFFLYHPEIPLRHSHSKNEKKFPEKYQADVFWRKPTLTPPDPFPPLLSSSVCEEYPSRTFSSLSLEEGFLDESYKDE